MSNIAHVMFTVAGYAILLAGSAAVFTFGVASVCRSMKWAPFNITVNIYNRNDAESPPAGTEG